MKTDDFIVMLATGIAPPAPRTAWRRFSVAVVCGIFSALLLMMAVLRVNPDWFAALSLPMFWIKLAFPVTIAIASSIGVFRLARPGVRLGAVPVAMAAPVAAMWVLAMVEMARVPVDERLALLFGQTWLWCPPLITMLSIPVFISVFWAVRELAPTRPTLTGAVSGLLSGAAGAAVYCLHCPEMSGLFLAVWYLLGMLIPAVIGAAVGKMLPRW
jgi:hypothetical protein